MVKIISTSSSVETAMPCILLNLGPDGCMDIEIFIKGVKREGERDLSVHLFEFIGKEG